MEWLAKAQSPSPSRTRLAARSVANFEPSTEADQAQTGARRLPAQYDRGLRRGDTGEPCSEFRRYGMQKLLREAALLHDSTAARVGALFQLLVQDTTAQDFGLPSSAIRLRM